MKKLTIFTPTYNRAYILPLLYESLSAQTCHDFEWLVIDDGSVDNTRELISNWKKEKKIDINYFYQDNAGKMMAHNRAVKESQAELFMCLDSDDHLCNEKVIEDVLSCWNSYIDKNTTKICGIIGYKQIGEKKERFPAGLEVLHMSTLFERGFEGETALIMKTDILSEFPFPYFEGEKFVTDVYVYDQIDQIYKFLLFPYNIQNCRYHEDGYSYNYMKLLFDNPKGYRAYHNQCVRFKKKGYLKSVICYIAISIRIGDKKLFTETSNIFLTLMMYPLGIIKYFFDSYRLSRI